MTVEKMREALTYVYGGPVWRYKVMGMENRQVIAIYKSMEREGRLKPVNDKVKTGAKKSSPSNDGIQMTIWDYIDRKDCAQ